MFLVYADRHELLKLLPKGGTVAEIGVAQGDFSQAILSTCNPDRLHLVDPWLHQARGDYEADTNNVTQPEADSRAEAVARRFAKHIEAGVVHVHRDFSVEAAARLPDASLDWIYVDGMHTKEAVLADLAAWAPKVKPDGLILGHDHANHMTAQQMGFGVVEAVDAFVQQGEWQMVVLTADNFPTYVLSRRPDSPACNQILAQAFEHFHMTEIRGRRALGFVQQVCQFPDGRYRVVPSFGMD